MGYGDIHDLGGKLEEHRQKVSQEECMWAKTLV
jgi:hypothetical protein